MSMSASGFVGRTFDVGAYEQAEIALIEVDAQERERRRERFAPDRLGDAIVRLYERYAELLPKGPERARAAAIARSVAATRGPVDLERYAATLAPAVEGVDHRVLGTWSAQGAEAVLRNWRSLLAIAADVTLRDDDILALRPNALVLRRTHLGTDRASGGLYERPFLQLSVFGSDGLMERFEPFDVGDEDDALARFDELVLSPVERLAAKPRAVRRVQRRVRANAATANAARTHAAIAARDVDALADGLGADYRWLDHTMTGAELN